MDLPAAPFFVSRFRDASGGVDFLGLRTVNLGFMDEFLPGINNVTTRVRPYSLMCWTASAFLRQFADRFGDAASHDAFVRFREKVEVLFNWSHHLAHDDAGLVGNSQTPPAAEGVVELSFAAWKRNVSLLDAVNYGPSLKVDNGLGFLVQAKRDIYVPTNVGEALAGALESALAQCTGHDALASVDSIRGDTGLAIDLYPGWISTSPSLEESSIFRGVFYQPDRIGKSDRHGERSASLRLILLALGRAATPMTVHELRRSMCLAPLPDELLEPHAGALRERQRLWQVLQLRQAQRLAFEALFGWAEMRVLQGRTLSTDLVEDLISAMQSASLISSGDAPMDSLLGDAPPESAQADSIMCAGTSQPSMDIFRAMDDLQSAIRRRNGSAAAPSVILLLLCARIAQQLARDAAYLEYLQRGEARRVSLDHWQRFVFARQQSPLNSFLLTVIENFLLSQHFGVAATRYTTGKQRLRLTIEERGLTPMIGGLREVWEPQVTPDRLEAALKLMADCGLVDRTKGLTESMYSVR